MKSRPITSVMIALAITLPLLLGAPAVFAQGGGRGGGRGSMGGGAGRGGGMGGWSGGGVGGGARGGVIGGGGRSHAFRSPSSHPHYRSHNRFYFGFGAGFYPGWWWYDPNYYWGPPPAYYPSYYGYPYYDYNYGYPSYGYSYDYPYSGYPYYDYTEYPYASDPCLSSDPAYAPYCPPATDPYQGGYYGTPPVNYPSPSAPAQQGSGGQLPPPSPPPMQPAPPGN